MRNVLIITFAMLAFNMAQAQKSNMSNCPKQGKYSKSCPAKKSCYGKHDGPLKHHFIIVNKLTCMQDELSLTEEQAITIIDISTKYKKYKLDKKAELKKRRLKMKNMLASEADPQDLKDHMKGCADIKIDMKIAAYEAANNIKKLLNEDQLKKLDEILLQCDQGSCPVR